MLDAEHPPPRLGSTETKSDWPMTMSGAVSLVCGTVFHTRMR